MFIGMQSFHVSVRGVHYFKLLKLKMKFDDKLESF